MKASRNRETKETAIEVSLETEGAGKGEIETGIEMLDEILTALAKGAGYDLVVKARGDLETGDHHTTEDVGIALGQSLAQVLKTGIGSSIVPSGECLALAAVSFGEPAFRADFDFRGREAGGMNLENFGHFLRTLAYNGKFTLSVRADGGSDRQKIEAVSTALGRALGRAALDA
jgi:imidazoleglycerol phosphate dehydratase HisB